MALGNRKPMEIMWKAAATLAHYLLKKVASDHTHPMKLCSQYCSANLRRLVTAG